MDAAVEVLTNLVHHEYERTLLRTIAVSHCVHSILMKVCHLLNPPDSPKPDSHIPPAAPALHRRRKKPWTTEDTRLLQEMRADGASWQRIAGSLHRNVTAVACRMHFLRLQPHTQTPASNLRRWSPEETNRLEVLVHNRVPYSIIAQRLDRTIDACSKKYNKMQPKKLRRGATTSVPLPRLALSRTSHRQPLPPTLLACPALTFPFTITSSQAGPLRSPTAPTHFIASASSDTPFTVTSATASSTPSLSPHQALLYTKQSPGLTSKSENLHHGHTYYIGIGS
jgi:hypothetical protein